MWLVRHKCVRQINDLKGIAGWKIGTTWNRGRFKRLLCWSGICLEHGQTTLHWWMLPWPFKVSPVPYATTCISYDHTSGRFEQTQGCASLCWYHPSLGIKSWSVETLLVGLQSFMYEESNAIDPYLHQHQRVKICQASHAFNAKSVFVEIFGDYDYDAAIAACSRAQSEEEVGTRICLSFCFSSEGELICRACRGSNEWVHLECLRQWQKM